MNDITSPILYLAYAGYSSAKGYSIWFPLDITYYNDVYSKYSALDFAQSTQSHEWSIFLYEEPTALAGANRTDKITIEK